MIPNKKLIAIAGFSAALGMAGTAWADLITFNSVTTAFNNPIGVDYSAPTNSLVLSVNYSSGFPNNLDLVAPSGAHSPFSSLSGATDEVYVASARTTANGFTAGETFVGNGQSGQIVRISPDGSTVTNPWITINDPGGLFRGALHIDTTGIAGGDLIAGTTTGNLYRITAAGVVTKIGHVGSDIEGITVVPNDPLRYGPWAGKILTGSDNRWLYAFDPNGGGVTAYDYFSTGGVLPLFAATENLYIPSVGETFYGVDFADGKLLAAGANQWTPYLGDVILGDENGNLWDITYGSGNFVSTLLAHVGQWEGATFAPTVLAGVTPEPASLALLGIGLAALGLRRRSRA